MTTDFIEKALFMIVEELRDIKIILADIAKGATHDKHDEGD